ncbi:alpha/beta fold hydrolase [Streptomyces sp. NPDC091377]|uniref:alpha/beta fold hydrolase n=1 Tax=unclassified Streptomyces TaxID=2593676 RepID=UPI0038190429
MPALLDPADDLSPRPAAPRRVRPYARTVRGTGPAGLLLAHGAAGSVEENYGPLMAALTAGHRVVGVDYPGTGGTPRADGPLELDELAGELLAAADAEGLERFALCGFSLGGAVAIRIAARHPERVTALVLTAPFPYADTELRLASRVWLALGRGGDPDTLGRFALSRALGSDALAALDPRTADDLARRTGATSPAGMPEQVDLALRVDVREDLAAIGAPTLVISPTGDLLVPPRLHRATAAGIPGARLLEIPGGHVPFADDPARWGGVIVPFLTEVAGAAGGRPEAGG